MGHEKQVSDVKKALDYEKQIESTEQRLRQLSQETFGAKPQPPIKGTVNRMQPIIESTVKFNWIVALLLLVFTSGIGTLVYYFAYYKPKREADIEQIRNSAEYKQKCADTEAEYDCKQKEMDDAYEKARINYETVLLPKYEHELAEWTEKRNAEIKENEAMLEEVQKELVRHYNEIKIVPLQYRTIPALQYIYDMISTSDYDVRQAIENYDKNEQRKLELARLEEQQQANQLAYEQNQLAYEQNDLLNEQNSIAQKARRDANIASVVGTVQRHNTNKALNKKFKK